MSLRPWTCALLVLAVAVISATVNPASGDDTLSLPDCSRFAERIPLHMNSIVSATGNSMKVDLTCDEGYLLDTPDASPLMCNETTGWPKVPDCREIPTVGFTKQSTRHDMSDPKLEIPVELFGQFVREFSVNVTLVNNSVSGKKPAAETEPFVLEEKLLNFTQREVLSVPVKVADTSVSGVNRNYTLCLSVMPSEGEIRALVAHDSMCTNVTIVNNNKAAVSLDQKHLVFTSNAQYLSFKVGYRTCNVHITLCLHEEEKADGDEIDCVASSDFVIPKTKNTSYTVDLLQQSAGFSSLDIGVYSGLLVAAGDGCGAVIKDPELTVEWTLTPAEIKNYAVKVGLSENMYDVEISLENATSSSSISISISSAQPYPIPVNLSISTLGESVIFSTSELVGPTNTAIDISAFIKRRIENADDLEERFWMDLHVITSPFVAMVTEASEGEALKLTFAVSVNFTSNYLSVWEDATTLNVTIATSRPLKQLDQYLSLQVSVKQTIGHSELLDCGLWSYLQHCPHSTEFVSQSGVNWNLSLELSDLPVLKVYTLTLTESRGESKESKETSSLTIGQPTTSLTIGAKLSFEKSKYTLNAAALTVTVLSSRDLGDHKLSDLVTFECEDLRVTVGEADGRKLSVLVRKKKESIYNVSVRISLLVKEDVKSVVTIPDDGGSTVVFIPPPHTGPSGKRLPAKVATTTDSVSANLNDVVLRMEQELEGVEWNGDNELDILPETTEDMGPEALTRFLKVKLRVMQEEIDRLCQELTTKEKQVMEGEATVKRLSDENSKLQRMQRALQPELEKQKAVAEGLRHKCGGLETQLTTLRKEVEVLKGGERKARSHHGAVEVRLNRALEEVERQRTELAALRARNEDSSRAERAKVEELTTENKQLLRQRNELMTAFKKQLRLIDILKRQKMHVEAAKLLSFTEEEFVKALDWEKM